ncbi:MAG: glycosyltransferase [Cytophagaceae bacterium]|jgi:glycosyltransferase involved in cell wall biosynthesis|nr:glycosyltransferase [Cytophagaceae bacterium]
MNHISFIIPVYNRPDELGELFESLAAQTRPCFEIIVVEDGSVETSETVCSHFEKLLPVQYIVQNNTGPGPARNAGAAKATGNWLIYLDSDCILPPNYLETVEKAIDSCNFDCFGGPDKAHESFNTIQKAIGYAMSSILTTGGIRGGKERMDIFYPRSYNLGVRAAVFCTLNGFSEMRFGEDLDFSMRTLAHGYSTRLIREAFVYHKRRNSFRSFYKQVFNSGMARINLDMRHPGTIKLVHWLPSLFAMGHIFIILLLCMYPFALLLLAIMPIMFFLHALFQTKEVATALLAVIASFTQLFGYGLGFMKAFILRKILKRPESFSFTRNFYK